MNRNRIPTPGGLADVFSSSVWQQFFIALGFSFKYGDFQVQYMVSELPNGMAEGATAYATNGRKVGEAAGNGTGVPVYWSNGSWRVYSTDAAVTA